VNETRLHVLRSSSIDKDVTHADETIPRPGFKWKTRVLIPGLILGGFLLLVGISAYGELAPAPVVEVSPVVVKSMEGVAAGAVTVQAPGWVEANPYRSYVTALANGIVREMLVLEGDSVTRGQVVARLVDEDARLEVQRARAKVKEREAALKAEEAELSAAKTEWENPTNRRQAVRVAQALQAESEATLKQISAEVVMEEANLEHAKSQYDRGVMLHTSDAVSEQELIRLRSNFLAREARVAALKMRLSAVKELIIKREADLEAAREHMALRTEDRKKVKTAEARTLRAEAALSQARTELAEAELRLKRMEIRSPMDGSVMSRLTEPGSKVVVFSDNPDSAKVLSLYDPERLQVRVDVPLADAAKVSVGQAAQVVVEVLPGKTFSGTVTRVLHEADIQKNTLEVKVALADPDPRLRPEMLARVKFLAEPDPDAESNRRVFVPQEAVHGSGRQAVAWVVRQFDGEQGTPFPQPVSLGIARIDGWADVVDGLNPGDLLVTSSVAGLSAGATVRVSAR
jgi:RND family efflux transporter MFP subunit